MTTVSISEETHRKLKRLKEKSSENSFDDILEKIADENLDTPSTDEMFGTAEIRDKEAIRERKGRIDRYEQNSCYSQGK
ncbi:MAG: hypothetical protein BRC29_01110 [Nanohaloarchaea archaeon SW_7_43_1]|nr:MAG: hypothetical protein BRC29_01110 [Nanohaloarchaea archaeon SW_7_43_1]